MDRPPKKLGVDAPGDRNDTDWALDQTNKAHFQCKLMKKATKYIHRMVKEWPFLVYRMRKALRPITVSMRKKQEGKRFQARSCIPGRGSGRGSGSCLMLLGIITSLSSRGTFHLESGMEVFLSISQGPKREIKKFSVFLSKIKKLRKDSLHIVGSRLFLFMGQEHCKQSSGSAVQVENSFSLVRTSQLLPWLISSCHILIFLLFSLSFRTSVA